jgi:3-deoxy-D-manno-octulosonic-acid transferase
LHLIYNTSILLYGFSIRIAALFSGKARNFISGRRNWKKKYRAIQNDPLPKIWLHAASLGEMEQGVPVLKKLREALPNHQVIISFFSPSGYLNFKQRELAEHIIYLPLDLPKNAKQFVDLIRPELALFIKYEIWPNYFKELEKRQIPTILAPAVFRPKQIYFRPYASSFFIPILKGISRILVQNEESKKLLLEHRITQVEVCGDSRFDQAIANSQEHYDGQKIQEFIGNQPCLVIGSSWAAEEKFLEKIIPNLPSLKVILAPHDASANNIRRVENNLQQFGLSKFSDSNWQSQNSILLIDNIGHLKKLYRFAHIALIGGGFGAGLHSTVEAIVYGIPVAFGPKHQKFIEVADYLKYGIGFEISTANDLDSLLRKLEDPNFRAALGTKINHYLSTKTGAADKISAEAIRLLQARDDD